MILWPGISFMVLVMTPWVSVKHANISFSGMSLLLVGLFPGISSFEITAEVCPKIRFVARIHGIAGSRNASLSNGKF